MDQFFRNRLYFCLTESGILGCVLSLLKSLYIWLRYRQSFENYDGFPIFLYWKEEIIIGKGARIRFEQPGRIYLGFSFIRSGSLKHDISKLDLANNSFLSVAMNLFLGPGVRIDLGVNAHLSFGAGTELANDVTVICKKEMLFGSDCIIAAGTIIRDTDAHVIHYDGRTGSNMTERIVIGDHVWIGNRALILKGVTIGDGAVIAAGAVVTKNVPAFSLAAGNPARIIREGIRWER